MARAFVAASSQYLKRTTVPVADGPLTVAAWLKPTTVAAAQNIVCWGNSGNGHFGRLSMVATGEVFMQWYDGTTSLAAQTTAQATAGAWAHFAGTIDAAKTGAAAFLNGANKVTGSSAAVNPSLTNLFNVGRYEDGSPFIGNYVNGVLAEVAVWNVVLTDDEIAALGKGVSPLLLRPTSLKAYYPLLNSAAPDVDRWNGGFDLTPNNTPTMAEHPRVYYPAGPALVQLAAANTGSMFALF